MNVAPDCHVRSAGMAVDVFAVIAYSAVCPVVVGARVTALTVIDIFVGAPLTAGGVDTVAPSPFATALAVTVPDTGTATVAPVTFACGMVAGMLMVAAFALAVVGRPEMAMVTVVLSARVASAAVNPAGNPEMMKFAGVIVAAYTAFESVYTMLASLTSCPAFRAASPVDVTAMALSFHLA